MDRRHPSDIVRLGPRVVLPSTNIIGRMDSVIHIAVPDRVVEPRSAATTSSSSDSASTCSPNDTSGRCEKPVSESTFTLPIILGVAIPVIGAIILFLILQRRLIRKRREEDANDRHASLDFGLGDAPRTGRQRKGPAGRLGIETGEKGSGRGALQMSMDMGMNSPYLLPPELQNSRESLHSLSRTIHQNEDPYRPVTSYTDGASMRSLSKTRDGSSIYTGSSNAPSRLNNETGTAELLANASRMSRSSPPTGFLPPPRQNSLPRKQISPVELSAAESPLPPPPYPVEPPQVHLSTPNAGIQRKGLPTSPASGQGLTPSSAGIADPRESYASNDGAALRASNNYLGAFITSRDSSPTPPSPPRKDIERDVPASQLKRESIPTAINTLPPNPRPVRKEVAPVAQQAETLMIDDESEYGDAFKVTPPSPGRENNSDAMRGQRFSMDVPPEQFARAGLGAPGFDARRLSMGFRPLPPDAVTESDDPEIRANRIRSFYKEYFDDSKPAPQGQYYEDYDENYLGDGAYYDPGSNNFVMPYAQPVTRRAMTPPPRGPRFQGRPRGRNGSMGAMSAGGRPAPRAFSSASGRMGPKRPLPPPADLNTLPTPSKLRDDSFALLGSIEFAPASNARERQAGRSDSPFGERKAYSPAVPAFAPVVSAFDELAPMPSPHLLRKSGTFTSLDFAPPRKFRDPDSMSDAGSIRSNRSGISSTQLGAIRNGAYRVSRIPKDVVFTKDDLSTTLKPQWGMRQ